MKILRYQSLSSDLYNQIKIAYKKGFDIKNILYIMIFIITWFIHTDLDLSKWAKYKILPRPQRREESHFLSVHINFINIIVFIGLSGGGSV